MTFSPFILALFCLTSLPLMGLVVVDTFTDTFNAIIARYLAFDLSFGERNVGYGAIHGFSLVLWLGLGTLVLILGACF